METYTPTYLAPDVSSTRSWINIVVLLVPVVAKIPQHDVCYAKCIVLSRYMNYDIALSICFASAAQYL